MTRDILADKLEYLGDSITKEYPLVAGILFCLAGLTMTGEEDLLAPSAQEVTNFILKKRNHEN